MATNAMNTTQLACWIPEYQSAMALKALEAAMVVKQTVWSKYQADLKWGDTLNVPITPNLGTADAVNMNTDLTLNAQNTTRVQIIVNRWNYKAVGIGYREQMQNRPDYLTAASEKAMYSVATAIDVYLATFFNNLTAGNIGTAGSALTDDVMLSGVEYMNIANAPTGKRSLTLDPESITDLFKIDKFLRDDYVAKGAMEKVNGLIGKSPVYGATVWMSNNVQTNGNYHWGGLYDEEAIACIIQKGPFVDMFDWKQKFTNVVRAQAIFGANVTRPTAGCCIHTRS